LRPIQKMRFIARHNVTTNDLARAAKLAARWTDILLSIFVVVVIIAILSQVLYSFGLYLWAAAASPDMLFDLLRFRSADISIAVLSWISILVTLCLPAFLFFAMRSLLETIFPAWRVRRLVKTSDIIGPTTYTVDDRGIRSERDEGADVFLPWTAFDDIRCDAELAVLLRNRRAKFFVPLAAFGRDREAVLTQIRAAVVSE
jgi:hypothetical protein